MNANSSEPYDCDLLVIGAGPAGLAAACQAWDDGVKRIVVVERDSEAGGILNQCIHPGFGLRIFKQELTGPEYAQRFVDRLAQTAIELVADTMVLGWTTDQRRKLVRVISAKNGCRTIATKAIVLAMGCRERPRGAISIPGARPSGIFTAGTAQRLMNREGYRVGRSVVILGSGDIGLIMARRMTLEGANVQAVVELMPWSNGLTRNIVQCLDDFGIPLYLSHTVTNIVGRKRLEKVVIARVDEQFAPVAGTERVFDCDTLLLSVGLIPENELTRSARIAIDPKTSGAVVDQHRETSRRGVFACGNALHVHDLVDFVTQESQTAGHAAALYVSRFADNDGSESNGSESNDFESNGSGSDGSGSDAKRRIVEVKPGRGINYVVPQRIDLDALDGNTPLMMRVAKRANDCEIRVASAKGIVGSFARERVAPAEMERLVLRPRDFESLAHDDVLTVTLEEKEARHE